MVRSLAAMKPSWGRGQDGLSSLPKFSLALRRQETIRRISGRFENDRFRCGEDGSETARA